GPVEDPLAFIGFTNFLARPYVLSEDNWPEEYPETVDALGFLIHGGGFLEGTGDAEMEYFNFSRHDDMSLVYPSDLSTPEGKMFLGEFEKHVKFYHAAETAYLAWKNAEEKKKKNEPVSEEEREMAQVWQDSESDFAFGHDPINDKAESFKNFYVLIRELMNQVEEAAGLPGGTLQFKADDRKTWPAMRQAILAMGKEEVNNKPVSGYSSLTIYQFANRLRNAVISRVDYLEKKHLGRSEVRTAEGDEALRKINAWNAEEFFDKMRAGYEAGTLKRISKYKEWAALKTEKKKIQGAGVLVVRKIQGQWKIFLGRQTWGNSKDFYVVPSGTVDKKPASRYEKAAGIAELIRLKIADENDRKTAEQESVPAGALRELYEEAGIRGRIAGRFNDNLVADKALRMNYFIHIDGSSSPEVEKGNGELVDPRWVPLWVILQAKEGKAGEAVETFLKGGRLLEGSKLRGFNEVKKVLMALAGPPAQTEEIEMEGRTRITRKNAGEFLRPGEYIRHPEEGVGKIIWVEGNQKGDDRAFKVQVIYLGQEGSEKHREYGESDFFGRHAPVFTATGPEKEAFYRTRREGDQAKAKKHDAHQARVQENIQELKSIRWTPYGAPFIRPINATGTAFIKEVEGIKERENEIFNLGNASQVERKILSELLGHDLVGRTNISEGNIRSKMRSRQNLFLEKLNEALDKNGSLSEEAMAKAEKNIFKSELFQKWLGFTDPATQKPVTKEEVQGWIRNGFIYVEWILKYEIGKTLKIGNKISINPRPLPRSEARHAPADIAVQAH
ncbi:MAG TPA: NUDIX domain-containing protein, partial [bacterium]|nr:NUDIX domain-containing protein [bacterium]